MVVVIVMVLPLTVVLALSASVTRFGEIRALMVDTRFLPAGPAPGTVTVTLGLLTMSAVKGLPEVVSVAEFLVIAPPSAVVVVVVVDVLPAGFSEQSLADPWLRRWCKGFPGSRSADLHRCCADGIEGRVVAGAGDAGDGGEEHNLANEVLKGVSESTGVGHTRVSGGAGSGIVTDPG